MGDEPPIEMNPGPSLAPVPEPDAPPSAAPPPPVHRPTSGGRLLRWIFFAGGVLGLALGAIGARSAAILSGRIDPDLVTIPELQAFALAAASMLLGLALVAGAAVVTGRRWAGLMRAALVAMTDEEPLLEPVLRTGRLALGLAVGGLALVAVGALLLLLPFGRDGARVAWAVLALGGLLLPIAAALLIWLIGDIERREALLIHALYPWQPAPGERDRRWPIAVMAALAVVAVLPPAANVPYLFSEHTCQASTLECRWILVQADQIANDPRGQTTLLAYGLHRAESSVETGRTARGTLVIATGGPGVSGIASADHTMARLGAELTDAFDVIFFDTRGVGESGYVDCPQASGHYQTSLTFESTAGVIEDFVESCMTETGVRPDDLAQYGSAHIAEDIETIRRDLGVDRIALYAESYGTLAAQRYAVAHPDHLSALILDGAIDIAQPTDASWIEATRGFDDVLGRTLATCESTPGCRFHDTSVWHNVIDSLKAMPVSPTYADAEGNVTGRPLTAEIARDTLISAMYDSTGRMLAMRALSAAEAGDWVPLARLVYSGSNVLIPNAVSDFGYNATSCADRYVEGADTDATQYLAWLKRSPFATSPAGSVYLSSAACHSWPLPPSRTAPTAVPAAADFPVVILAATGDPITPATHGRRIFDRYRAVADTYLVETEDGPHVTFGRGRPCPDDIVLDLIVRGARPTDARTTCPGEIAVPYLDFPDAERSQDPVAFRSAALDLELLAHPDYWIWDGVEPLVVGCRYGGRLEVTTEPASVPSVERITVDDCAIVRDEPMAGSGTYRGIDEAEFEIDSPRIAFTYRIVGANRYTKEEDHISASWRGTYLGRAYDGRR
jgi:pimeloyl-ACP methyl ester carboxylesterase